MDLIKKKEYNKIVDKRVRFVMHKKIIYKHGGSENEENNNL